MNKGVEGESGFVRVNKMEKVRKCGEKYVIKCGVKIAKNERKNEFSEKQEGNFGLKQQRWNENYDIKLAKTY